MTQLSFFDISKSKSIDADLRACPPEDEGSRRRDKGILKAAQHAEEIYDQWQMKALAFLETYAMNHHRFSGEMVRLEARGIVPEPPSLRAWGGILMGASKRGWIKQVGYVRVENPRAHKANAALWESCLKCEF